MPEATKTVATEGLEGVHIATRDIIHDGKVIAKGSDIPGSFPLDSLNIHQKDGNIIRKPSLAERAAAAAQAKEAAAADLARKTAEATALAKQAADEAKRLKDEEAAAKAKAADDAKKASDAAAAAANTNNGERK